MVAKHTVATTEYYEQKIKMYEDMLEHLKTLCEDEIAYFYRHSHDVLSKVRADMAKMFIEHINTIHP